MTTVIRRPITLAASNPYQGRWDRDAACKGPARDRFFVSSGKAQEESRAHCRSCPVLDRCLSTTVMREGFSRDRWGVSGGLSEKQRIALAWEQRLRGPAGTWRKNCCPRRPPWSRSSTGTAARTTSAT